MRPNLHFVKYIIAGSCPTSVVSTRLDPPFRNLFSPALEYTLRAKPSSIAKQPKRMKFAGKARAAAQLLSNRGFPE
jgi:hypothetical protein